jgi:flagellar FliJ protein
VKSSIKLRPVVRVAEQREQSAASQLGGNMRQLELQQKQLDELIAYRAKYEQNYLTATQTGLSVAQVRDYQIFLTRLDNAIMEQRQVVMGSSQDKEASQVNWQGARGHSKMINKVVETRQQEERQQNNLREQRESDDNASTVLISGNRAEK